MNRKGFWLCWLMVALGAAACGNVDEKQGETKTPIAGARSMHEGGKNLFYAKCASCHMVNKEMTGPALRGVEQRWPDQQLLYAFIRNSDSVIQTNKYARELWLRYNQTAMLPHPDLMDDDIRKILDYINAVSVVE